MKEYNELGQIDEISGLLKSDYFRIEITFFNEQSIKDGHVKIRLF